MKSIRFSLGHVASLLLAAFVLSGFISCVHPDNSAEVLPENVYALSSDDSIVGTWTNSYSYEYNGEQISVTEKYVFGTDSVYSEGYWAISNPYIYTINETSGYVYGLYTKAMNDDWSYSETAPDVGKWYAIFYSDLATVDGKTTVKISGAYKADGKSSTDTLEEAVAEFTVANGYFNGNSPCTKQ